MKKVLLNPTGMFIIGLMLGAITRLLDIYTQNLGNVFSQMAIWILFGVIISIHSETKKNAMINVLLFCIGMLITYYAAAVISHGVYGKAFIIGWTVFALCTPVLACFAWMTKEKGVFSKVIGIGIVLVSVLSTIILFDRLRIYDYIIDALLVYFLFFKKVKR